MQLRTVMDISAADRTLMLNINCFERFSVTYDVVFSVTVFGRKMTRHFYDKHYTLLFLLS